MSTLGKIIVALSTLVAPAAAAGVAATAGRALKPVTWGIERPGTAQLQQVALAVGAAKALPRLPSARQDEIVIDVLVAYTRKAARHYYEIERDVVELAIEEANQSFRLSGIGHIRLRLAHAFQTGYVERGAHFDHLWRMADKEGEHMAHIHALREAYRADVVVLIVDDAKGCGLATRIGADADEAFAVVHHACAAARYTLAHEVGHIMGARHELAYVSGNAWRDIMSYKDACNGCPRLHVWSNPLVRIGGEPAGTMELNNARIIAQNAARVAAFR
jgi:hypothetical protein